MSFELSFVRNFGIWVSGGGGGSLMGHLDIWVILCLVGWPKIFLKLNFISFLNF